MLKLASWQAESVALVRAARRGELSVASALLRRGADPNAVQVSCPRQPVAAQSDVFDFR